MGGICTFGTIPLVSLYHFTYLCVGRPVYRLVAFTLGSEAAEAVGCEYLNQISMFYPTLCLCFSGNSLQMWITIITSIYFVRGQVRMKTRACVHVSLCVEIGIWYFIGILFGSPLAVAKAAATLLGVHTKHET